MRPSSKSNDWGQFTAAAVACLVLATSAWADSGQTPGALPEARSFRGSSWEGIYRSTFDTTRGLQVRFSSRGALDVALPGGARTTALLDGERFFSVIRERRQLGAVAGRQRILRIERDNEGRLHTCYSAAIDSAFADCETWAPALSLPAPIVVARDSSQPRIGDYVYVEELPEAITRVHPEYPDELRKRGVVGTVMVQALVGTDGLVKDVRTVKSIPELDPLAVAAVRGWKFKPALAHGKPVAVWVGVPIKFPPP